MRQVGDTWGDSGVRSRLHLPQLDLGMSYFDWFSARARRAIFLAHRQAIKEGAQEITPEHILSALLAEDPELFAIVLPQNPNAVGELQGNLTAVGRARTAEKVNGGNLPLSARAKEVVFASWEERKRLGHKSVGTQHLLLGLLTARRRRSSWFRRSEPQEDPPAKQILVKYGFSAASVEAKIKEGIVTPLTWVLDDSIIKLNAQLMAVSELLISKGIFKRSEFVAILDQNADPLAPKGFLVPLIDALFEKGRLTTAEKENVKSTGLTPSLQEGQTPAESAPAAGGKSSTDPVRD
jgi:hypothetical protein